MRAGRHPIAALVAATLLAGGAVQAADLDEVVGRHMVAQARLAAHLVAVAEGAGMAPEAINAILADVAERSAIDEFWITDADGRAYLTNTGIDFTFDPDPALQPQASAFWALLTGEAEVVVQEAQKREIDDRVFKYVGVAGVDQPRIVQIGIDATSLQALR
jgi:hypothetical protein